MARQIRNREIRLKGWVSACTAATWTEGSRPGHLSTVGTHLLMMGIWSWNVHYGATVSVNADCLPVDPEWPFKTHASGLADAVVRMREALPLQWLQTGFRRCRIFSPQMDARSRIGA